MYSLQELFHRAGCWSYTVKRSTMLAGMFVSAVDGGIIVCSRDEEIPRWRHSVLCLALAWGRSLGKKCAERLFNVYTVQLNAFSSPSAKHSWFLE